MKNDLSELFQVEKQECHAELSACLLEAQARTPAKYLYDPLGSRLFEAICELPEYYPTRTEVAIFDANLQAIANAAGIGSTLIDLGAGNCAKATKLIPVLRPRQYVPVDISEDFMRAAIQSVRQRFPELRITGVGMDFSENLQLPPQVDSMRRLFFYPGSSIGNFPPGQALDFLKQIRSACATGRHGNKPAGGGLLIGVDLIKDRGILQAAYDDAIGVTAAFNLNLLLHLNGLLGANFNPRQWRHRAIFNSLHSRIEMHLDAMDDLSVAWGVHARHFRKGESIHTESSYKYTPSGFVQMLGQAGFGNIQAWQDESRYYMVCHATPV
ncbi:L-histidine N(alpha)-methyltransferase [Undibacterium sp. TJN25]|uniref:L-histidine N(alpha)-methyltransferase n=1 Tax=Undibacterium sp. TJN25 TaxID=3413056 RepID=UPI003BF29188